ncbi:J domain-containing protein-like [Actinia tenebrosa]|uniref:J domain-containing protein-like n=1 Tax=Actinia tenebrosa TaxID=6105 RepID=A0A6P8HED0_ACTTE|nr:J domain-containing protein-like [Actinia tenebrosa]
MAQFTEKNCCDFLTRKDQQDLYELLGCDELNSKEQINAEFKRKALQFHPDKNRNKEDGNEDEAHQMFERLKKARDILCDDSNRRQYDYWRRIGLQDYVTFDEWMEKSSHMQASIHWAPKAPKKYMLADTEHAHTLCKENTKDQDESNNTSRFFRKYSPYARTGWGPKSHLIRKFQNYEI